MKIFSDALSLVKIRLEIAKNIFIFSAFLYFLALLMTVGGYEVQWTARLAFALYPVFTLSLFLLVFQLFNYVFALHFEKGATWKYSIFLVLFLLYLATLFTHLGLISGL